MATQSQKQRQRKVVVTTSPAPSDPDSLRDSYFSQASHSTAPTSFHSTSTSHNKNLVSCRQKTPPPPSSIAPVTETLFDATCSASSVVTYDSALSDMEPLCREGELDEAEYNCSNDDDDSVSAEDDEEESGDDDDIESEIEDNEDYVLSDPSSVHIPPVLPPYRAASYDAPARPSTPQDFARLFPSLDRLAVRHDDLTPDGNMNLRVDTIVPSGPGRHPLPIQLFHLRMHDLARREFSLRRYCRESGREVCNSKRAYAPAPLGNVTAAHPAIRRSMSSAIRTVTQPFHRTGSGPSPLSKHLHDGSGVSISDAASVGSGSHQSTKSSTQGHPKTPKRLVPTNRIRLEFSNYARVDVARRGGRTNKRYEFSWWGHKYTWKRVIDKNLNIVSFHLIRDGHTSPVAHVVPETRGPNQVLDDEMAGAWVPPCHMWISDSAVLDAITDVADVIVATGLIVLVDDCIKERWAAKKPSHRAIRTSESSDTTPRAIMDNIFHRRTSEDQSKPGSPSKPSSPLKFGIRPVRAY